MQGILTEAEMEIEVNSADENGKTPLMDAVHEGNEELVYGLLEIGANVNAQAKNGLTALMIAAMLGRKSIVLMLLQAHANPHLTAGGMRASRFAEQAGHQDISRLLQTTEAKPW